MYFMLHLKWEKEKKIKKRKTISLEITLETQLLNIEG